MSDNRRSIQNLSFEEIYEVMVRIKFIIVIVWSKHLVNIYSGLCQFCMTLYRDNKLFRQMVKNFMDIVLYFVYRVTKFVQLVSMNQQINKIQIDSMSETILKCIFKIMELKLVLENFPLMKHIIYSMQLINLNYFN